MPSSTPGYGQGITNWVGSETATTTTTSPSSVKIPGGLGGGESTWRQFPHETAVTPGYSPYAAHHQPQTTAGWPPAPIGSTAVGATEAVSRSEDAWSTYPQPVRSLSYSGEHTASQYLPNRSPYERKASVVASDMYPPPITTNIETMASTPGTSTMGSHASLSAGALPSATYTTWQQHPYQYPKSGDEYGSSWYDETGGHPGHGAHMYYGTR